ncbi:MAG: hypothetical protein SGJ09_07145 [Phycisphaerae bacterium]|nr:hypothetical protein [Phycisphaerae bacterium]
MTTVTKMSIPRGERSQQARSLVVGSAIAVIAVLVACDSKVENAVRPGTPAPPPAAANSESRTVIGGGGSALGKAKNSAERIGDKVADHNREIEKQAEEINKP